MRWRVKDVLPSFRLSVREILIKKVCEKRESGATGRPYSADQGLSAAPRALVCGYADPIQSWRPNTITRYPSDPAGAYHVPVELYDFASDPLEWMNLASSAAHAEVRRSLLDRLYTWMRDTEDPLLQGIPAPPIHKRALAALTGGAIGKESK